MRIIFAALSCFLIVAPSIHPATSQAQTTIFSDDFSGSGLPLNGTTPDITTNGEVWEAGNAFFDDGTADSPIAASPDGQAAHLDFTPISGAIYTAEATVVNTNPNWIAFGFLPDDPTTADWTVQSFAVRHSNAPGYAWMLTRNNASANNQEGFLGGGTAGAQPWNGNVVDATQPIDFKIILDTSGTNWTAQWFFNNVSQGDPVAYAVEGNPGIGGIGFSHERNATANSGATMESFSLVQELPPTLLTLFVNTNSGETVLQNTSGEPVSLDYYIVESAGNALDVNNWNSLQDQGLAGSQAADFDKSGGVDTADLARWEGDFGLNADSDADNDLDSDGIDFLAWQRQFGQAPGAAESWHEAGGASSSQLAELLLNTVTTLGPGDELTLGNAFNPAVFGAGADGDLTFRFGAPNETLRMGSVVYQTSAISSAAVPEPSTLGLVLALLGLHIGTITPFFRLGSLANI